MKHNDSQAALFGGEKETRDQPLERPYLDESVSMDASSTGQVTATQQVTRVTASAQLDGGASFNTNSSAHPPTDVPTTQTGSPATLCPEKGFRLTSTRRNAGIDWLERSYSRALTEYLRSRGPEILDWWAACQSLAEARNILANL
jgi:hypothetical protein